MQVAETLVGSWEKLPLQWEMELLLVSCRS